MAVVPQQQDSPRKQTEKIPADGSSSDRVAAGQFKPCHVAALAYLKREWSVIPVNRDKKAARDWKKYQTERATERDLDSWYGSTNDLGVAIVLGDISGGLYVRDFDIPASYEKWAAEHPGPAAMLPTVKTHRGFHVYFSWNESLSTRKFDDGEVRGHGSYVVAPPSTNKNGEQYKWLNKLRSRIPTIDPNKVGFLQPYTGNDLPWSFTERTEGDNKSSITLSVKQPLETLSVKKRTTEVDACILRTQPTGPGQRHGRVFDLARALKGLPSLADASFMELEPIVEIWHAMALPVIGTKDWDDSWIDFVDAWNRVRWPEGKEILDVVKCFIRGGTKHLVV